MTQNTKQCVIGCAQLVSKIQAEIKGINNSPLVSLPLNFHHHLSGGYFIQ